MTTQERQWVNLSPQKRQQAQQATRHSSRMSKPTPTLKANPVSQTAKSHLLNRSPRRK